MVSPCLRLFFAYRIPNSQILWLWIWIISRISNLAPQNTPNYAPPPLTEFFPDRPPLSTCTFFQQGMYSPPLGITLWKSLCGLTSKTSSSFLTAIFFIFNNNENNILCLYSGTLFHCISWWRQKKKIFGATIRQHYSISIFWFDGIVGTTMTFTYIITISTCTGENHRIYCVKIVLLFLCFSVLSLHNCCHREMSLWQPCFFYHIHNFHIQLLE